MDLVQRWNCPKQTGYWPSDCNSGIFLEENVRVTSFTTRHLLFEKEESQREPGRRDGVDKNARQRGKRTLSSDREEIKNQRYFRFNILGVIEPLQEDSSLNSSELDSEDFPTLIEITEPGISKSVIKNILLLPKLVVVLDR
ncbi:hypothetical protein AVEN_68745-1 [Araneus ventricosus]|uniref:Uncharacterized protein n=1 Tax=Araneus ventricosus TaxID=182803 RepID=A0A4Y2C4X9_ARAVE|nr:hypothetical protein AVEN_68745-1 [Araneus ventricosus]